MRVPVDARKQLAADVLAENDRQRWLVRTYPAGDPRRRSDRRVVGVHTSRPSDRARGSEKPGGLGGPRSFSLGSALTALGLLALMLAGAWLALAGLIWLGIEVLRWVMEIFVGGKV